MMTQRVGKWIPVISPIAEIIRHRLHGNVDRKRVDLNVGSTLFLEPVKRTQSADGWDLNFLRIPSSRKCSTAFRLWVIRSTDRVFSASVKV